MTYILSIKELPYLNQTSQLRKEFKIMGVIGSAGSKDLLRFVSLSHQINYGSMAGYSEKEIIAGVLNAMAPNLSLRNVLENYYRLSSSKVNEVFIAHIKEGNAPDL